MNDGCVGGAQIGGRGLSRGGKAMDGMGSENKQKADGRGDGDGGEEGRGGKGRKNGLFTLRE